MKIKTLFVCFFKCSFLKRGCAVIFELNDVSTSNFVKFQCQLITLNYLEKTKQNISVEFPFFYFSVHPFHRHILFPFL